MIKVLLIDDKKSFWYSLLPIANEHGIELHYAMAEDSAIDYLKSMPSIQGVIIDGVGLKRESQPANSEQTTHAYSVIRAIESWERETARHTLLAKCIFTAWPDTYKSVIDRDDIPVFGKNEEPDETIPMLEYLKVVIRESYSFKIRDKYSTIFYAIKSDFFLNNQDLKKHFNKSVHHTEALDLHFIDLAKYLDNPVYDEKFFSVCRKILEIYFISLRRVALRDQFFKRDEPNQQECLEFIVEGKTWIRPNLNHWVHATEREKNYFDDPIRYSFQYLKYITNDFSHLQTELYSKYLLMSTVYCFFSTVLWLSHKKDIGKEISKSISQVTPTSFNITASNGEKTDTKRFIDPEFLKANSNPDSSENNQV
jgi:hypothetical protein